MQRTIQTSNIPNDHIRIITFNDNTDASERSKISETLIALDEQKKLIYLTMSDTHTPSVDFYLSMIALSTDIIASSLYYLGDHDRRRTDFFFLAKEIKYALCNTPTLLNFLECNTEIKQFYLENELSHLYDNNELSATIELAQFYSIKQLKSIEQSELLDQLKQVAQDKLFIDLHLNCCNYMIKLLSKIYQNNHAFLPLFEQFSKNLSQFVYNATNLISLYQKNLRINFDREKQILHQYAYLVQSYSRVLQSQHVTSHIFHAANDSDLPVFLLVNKSLFQEYKPSYGAGEPTNYGPRSQFNYDSRLDLNLPTLLKDNEYTYQVIPLKTCTPTLIMRLAALKNVGNQSLLTQIEQNEITKADFSQRFLTLDDLKKLIKIEILKNNSTLTELDFSGNQCFALPKPEPVNIDSINNFLSSTCATITTTLTNSWQSLIENQPTIVSLVTLPTLKYLRLSGCGIDDACVIALSEELKKNKTLIELDLNDNNIGNAGAIALFQALQENKTLKSLNLEDNHIGQKESEKICKIIQNMLLTNKALVTLKLDYNFYDEEIANKNHGEHIVTPPIKGLFLITKGLFSNNNITEFTLDHLSANGKLDAYPPSWPRITPGMYNNIHILLEQNFVYKYAILLFDVLKDENNSCPLNKDLLLYIGTIGYFIQFSEMNKKLLIKLSIGAIDQINPKWNSPLSNLKWDLEHNEHDRNCATEYRKGMKSLDEIIKSADKKINKLLTSSEEINETTKLFCQAFLKRDSNAIQELINSLVRDVGYSKSLTM